MTNEEFQELVLSELKGIKSDVFGVKSEITEMKSDISGMKSEMTDMKSDISSMKSEISTMKGQQQENTGIIKALLHNQGLTNAKSLKT